MTAMARSALAALATLCLGGAAAPPAPVEPGDCWAVIPTDSGKNNIFLHLDKGYYISYDTLSVQQSVGAVMLKTSYQVRSFYGLPAGDLIAADILTSVQDVETKTRIRPRPGHKHLFTATLADGSTLSGQTGVTMVAKRADLVAPMAGDPQKGARLHDDILGGKPVDLRYSISGGGTVLLSTRVTGPYAAKPNYRLWALKTARNFAAERMRTGQCPILRNFQ